MLNKFNLPESFEESFQHYYLPTGIGNTGIMSDMHLPYHSIKALNEAFEYFIQKNVDSILLNGDVLDCYQLSKFQPDPRQRHFADEILAFQQFIRSLKEAFPGKPIYYKLGNHEERYEKIMITRCPEFLNIAHFEFENVLGCSDMGINVIKDKRTVYIGKLPVFHGHELNMKGVSVNPARSLFLKTKASAMCSHLHRTSQHTEPSIKEDISCWSTGHLGDEHPKYAPVNNWNRGIARVEKNTDGDFEVINFPLKQNKLFALTA
jgi:predicted phosphodiesterase